MKHLRILSVVTLLLFVAGAGRPVHAEGEQADENRAKRMKNIMKGLEHGLEALQALEQGELADRVRHLLLQLRERQGAEKQRRKSEHEMARAQLKLLHMAHDVLADAERTEHAAVIKHAREALTLTLKRRTDEGAMKIRRSAPTPERQAAALFMAAEILADHGKKDRAEMLVALGRRLQGKKRKGPDTERRAYLEGLKGRVEVMRTAVIAFREGERKDLAESMERAIHTGELLLEGRQDEEVRAVYERTPGLGDLAELLGFAAKLWAEFGHEKKAAACKELSQYYLKRWRAQQQERKAAAEQERHAEEEARERAGVDEHVTEMERLAERRRQLAAQLEAANRERERAIQISRLHDQMIEMLKTLKRMQEQVSALEK